MGKAGKNLEGFLEVLGLRRSEIYVTNTVKLRPTKLSAAGRRVNRPPTREEKELFRLLFMRDRTGEPPQEEDSQTMQIIRIIMEQGKMSEQAARRFHGEMWIFVHGIATMMATGYLQPEEETVSAMLTDIYQGQLRYRKEEQE